MSKNEAALKLARSVAGKVFRERARKVSGERYLLEMHYAKVIEQGDGDDYDAVQSALAAILEVTERAAAKADDYEEWCGGWGLVKNLSAASQGASEVATALRNHEHLKAE